MKSQKILCLLLVSTIFALLYNPGIFSTNLAYERHEHCKQAADLQFTTSSVSLSVEQGGSNTTTIRVQNYGGETGSATIEVAGGPLTGITFAFSTTSVTDLGAGSYQDITVTISATASLLPLGPRGLDYRLMNGTTELDRISFEIELIAPPGTTPTTPGIPGFPWPAIIIGLIIAVGIPIIVRRRNQK